MGFKRGALQLAPNPNDTIQRAYIVSKLTVELFVPPLGQCDAGISGKMIASLVDFFVVLEPGEQVVRTLSYVGIDFYHFCQRLNDLPEILQSNWD